MGSRHSAAVIALLLALTLAGCGGRQSMASKSAAAYEEAKRKGEPIGMGEHGSTAGMQHGGTAGMQHGGTPEMKHGEMPGMKQDGMSGMKHSEMSGMKQGGMAGTKQTGMAGMQHGGMSEMKQGGMAGMKHGSVAGMQHSGMAGMQHGSVAGMQHSGMAGMQHGGMAGMQHGGMTGMQMEEGSQVMPAPDPPRSSAEIARIRPADTLRADDFDTPAPAPAPAAADEVGKKGAMHMGHDEPAQHAPAGAVYTCVMHPEVTSAVPGVCPKCGMKLVRKEEKKEKEK